MGRDDLLTVLASEDIQGSNLFGVVTQGLAELGFVDIAAIAGGLSEDVSGITGENFSGTSDEDVSRIFHGYFSITSGESFLPIVIGIKISSYVTTGVILIVEKLNGMRSSWKDTSLFTKKECLVRL